jgi:hypothetical protein
VRRVSPLRVTSRGLVRGLVAAAAGLLAIGLVAPMGLPLAEAKAGGKAKGKFEHGCRVQPPQKFLERRSFVNGRVLDARKQLKAVRYLVERYGHVNEETKPINSKGALSQAKNIRFMGLPISVHAKIAPALTCVEKRLLQSGTGGYKARAIGGFRAANTFRGSEISNHLFGVAIDIDPDRNPCCGCVDPWPSNPICKRPGPVYKRTSMPRKWIQAFEHFGFDWLGHDSLEDTMHFEFLGDPDRIKK